ncbi:MAG: squalene synthase [Bacteroidota bacterium]
MELSISDFFRYPDEFKALFKIKRQHKEYQPEKKPLNQLAEKLDDIDFCYAVLGKVSRSFSVVIQQLPCELKDPVCLFYLVLRALDSIEDDTRISKEDRITLLKNFHQFHQDPEWNIKGVGDSEDYQLLLENYSKVISSFSRLDQKYQNVIMEICREMGEGMCEFLDKEVKTVEEYDRYCYYVAGLVGVGLSRLFVEAGIENEEVQANEDLSISMGLFLQKTNIIRDYHEDIVAGRTFWPQEIWGEYSERLEDMIYSESEKSMKCLNHLITDALKHATDSLKYLKQIRNPEVFRFCAIPQVMAIATLNEIFNNADVFRRNVKIRKGLAAKLILGSSNYDNVRDVFQKMVYEIFSKVSLHDDKCVELVSILNNIVSVDKPESENDHSVKQELVEA